MEKHVFILEVDGTKSRSWQGSLEWVQGQKKESFRSMLELLRLINSVVDRDAAQEGPPFTPESTMTEWKDER